MASVTIKDIPDELLARLRLRAVEEHRSLNKEAIHLLDLALSGSVSVDDPAHRRAAVERQVATWAKLAGRWESDKPIEAEIADIYQGRTLGREISLGSCWTRMSVSKSCVATKP